MAGWPERGRIGRLLNASHPYERKPECGPPKEYVVAPVDLVCHDSLSFQLP